MSEWTYIGAAYGLTWVVLAAYIAYVRRRLGRAEAVAREAAAAGAERRMR